MLPAPLNLDVYQGDDWERVLVFRLADGTPENLSGKTGRAQIRKSADDDQVLAEMTVTVSGVDGTVTLAIPSEVTSDLPAGSAVWDLQLTPPTRTRLAGKVKISKQVTR